MKWYEKIWKWIKKYWGVVLSAVTLATDYFTVGAKATYKQISLKVGHQCIHPVVSSYAQGKLRGVITA